MASPSNSLVVRREAGIVTAVIHRPEKLNALSKTFFEELGSLIEVLETDRTVRCLILTGSGDKAFSVGADLKERQGMTEKDAVQRGQFVRALYLRLERLPFPVIAAINGTALGGGLELALACDLRVAAENATLGLPEVELGIMPGNGGTQRLPRIVGKGKALELILLARRLSAAEAKDIGLVHSVVNAGQAMAHARSWAAKLSESAPMALRQAKAAIRLGMERTLEEGLLWEIECYKPLLSTKDRIEGLKAFSEKRKPVYKNE